MKNVLLILVDHRKNAAVGRSKKLLTAWGLSDQNPTRFCTKGYRVTAQKHGLIICELVGKQDQLEELKRKLETDKRCQRRTGCPLKFND